MFNLDSADYFVYCFASMKANTLPSHGKPLSASDLLEAKCLVCDTPTRHYLFSIQGASLHRCEGCGFILAESQPQPASQTTDKSSRAAAPDTITEQLATRQYLAELKSLCPKGEKLLVIAADGHPIEQESHWADFRIAQRTTAQAWKDGLPLGHGYDAALVIYQLEATSQPHLMLQAIRNALTENGILILVTTMLDSWSARFFKTQWIGWSQGSRCFFDTKTLRLLLLKTGFGDLWLQPDRRSYTLEHVAHRAASCPRLGLSRFTRLLHALTPRLLARRCHIRMATSGTLATAKRVPLSPPPLLSIVVPVYNEKATFCKLMDGLLARKFPGVDREIIVVESNSKDGTREAVLSYQAHPEVKVLLQDRPMGKGNAVRAGFAEAKGDILMIQDADLEYDLDDYPSLLEPLLNWRELFVLGARHGGAWKMRQFAGQHGLSMTMNFGHVFFTALINVLYGQHMKDPFTMYKVFRRDCIHGLTFDCNRFDFDHELVIKLVLKGYTPLEIPVNYTSRSFREGKKVRLFQDPLRWLYVDLRHFPSHLLASRHPFGRTS